MKVYTLKKSFHGYKKRNTVLFDCTIRIYWSEGVCLRTKDLQNRISINESELQKNFTFIKRNLLVIVEWSNAVP